MFSFSFFRLPEYTQYCTKNFDRTKYFVVYVTKTYFMVLGISGMLQPPFFKPFSKFVTYNNNRNTYEYIVLFRGIIDIMEPYRNNMKRNNMQILWQ